MEPHALEDGKSSHQENLTIGSKAGKACTSFRLNRLNGLRRVARTLGGGRMAAQFAVTAGPRSRDFSDRWHPKKT